MPTVRSRDIDVHYEVSGSGPAIVLMHSFLCSGAMWAGQRARLQEHHRVITIELPGHGRSGPAVGPYRLDDLVDDTVAVLDELSVVRAVWAGLSIGGMTALRGALHVPNRVSAIVVIDSDAGAEVLSKRLRFSALGSLAGLIGVRPLRRTIVREMFGHTTRRTQQGLVREWAADLGHVHVPSARHTIRALVSREDLTQRLHTIEQPALVVVGEEDLPLPPARSRRMAHRLPNATYQEIAAAGHLSALEQPERVTDAVTAFLRSHAL